VTVDRLQIGMSRADVENIYGRPEKIILASLTEDGLQEILVHKFGNDLYILEFMNDYLIRYEFLREDIYVQPRPLPPPVVHPYPVHPAPVEPPTRPSQPAPPPTTKPASPPPSSTRPATSTPSASSGRQERQKSENSRPARQGRRSGSVETNQTQQNETNRSQENTGQDNQNVR